MISRHDNLEIALKARGTPCLAPPTFLLLGPECWGMATTLWVETVGSSEQTRKLQESRNLAPWWLWSHHTRHTVPTCRLLWERNNLQSCTEHHCFVLFFCYSRLNEWNPKTNAMGHLPSTHRTVIFRHTVSAHLSSATETSSLFPPNKCFFAWVQTHGIFL